MPVAGEDRDKAAAYSPLAKTILAFLRMNSKNGYALEELYSMCCNPGHDKATLGSVKEALNELVSKMDVRTKYLNSKDGLKMYYRYDG